MSEVFANYPPQDWQRGDDFEPRWAAPRAETDPQRHQNRVHDGPRGLPDVPVRTPTGSTRSRQPAPDRQPMPWLVEPEPSEKHMVNVKFTSRAGAGNVEIIKEKRRKI